MVQKSHRLVLINDREVDSDTARYRPTLISDELRLAKQKFGHALCLCRTPPLKLIIRERGDTVHLACWPDESYLHSSDCAFYTEHYSGARSEGLVVDGENKTHATYHQPWIADSDGSKTKQGESVKLWALLHHLWESSGLYCWVPGWQRNWAIAQRVLTRAAKRTVVNGESLADHIYIPAPFAHSRKEEIQVEWSQFVDPIRSMHRGQGKRATGFILGEVRSLKPVGQGFLLCLKHHGPGVHIGPVMAKNLTHIARRGWVELTQPASQPDRSMSVVALLRVEALADGLLVAADCVLMRTSNLIPSNCQVEDELIGRLMKEGREFVRPLSYRQAALDLPVIVLHDVHRGAVDSRLARYAIKESIVAMRRDLTYWLDFGNKTSQGQAILGQICSSKKEMDSPGRLPHAGELFPDLVNPNVIDDDDGPSCSLAEALERQSLYINQAVTIQGMNILWNLFTKGVIANHGAFIDLDRNTVLPLRVDPAHWARFGIKQKKPRKAKAPVAI